ncbi:putative NADH:flavin oxidoreductase/NADH oxidase [uncultured Desulfatiglans sp.]|uniref:Putative NADH:flavin oxidoreductase/NADH oxidase n=1 Tax=Uncultured Desulfatiglans sp. TaxID=1748965 RepID=A0A653A9X5_UNCDX|nr:putative NADH:flavin oxidoreductase/NADH oxidase [uncultured Desulfatiglans sp.]
MNTLFMPTKIGALEVRNRFVRSATFDAGADNWEVSKWQMELFSNLAEKGAGLIISGIFHVVQDVGIPPWQNLLTEDRFIPNLRRLVDSVHAHGSKLAVQLFNSGRTAYRRLSPLGIEALGPSAIKAGEDPYFEGGCRAMNEDEIWTIVRGFGEATRRAREAGCDSVQIHGAHAYLLAEFLSPQSNRRRDDWGGSLDNRLKLHREIYRAAREFAGPDFPIMIKLGVADGIPDGLELEEGLAAAEQLARLGYDAIEVSQGLRGTDYAQTEFKTAILKREQEAYFRDWTKQVKGRVNVTTIIMGGLRSFDLMEEIVAAGDADFVALCRPLIREPHLIAAWSGGDFRKPTCISCNKCFENVISGGRLRCMIAAEN